jgi:hypothetical protein
MSELKSVKAPYHPDSWELALKMASGETETLDLTKDGGFGLDSKALKSVAVCECGRCVWFPDFPPPGAVISFGCQSASSDSRG